MVKTLTPIVYRCNLGAIPQSTEFTSGFPFWRCAVSITYARHFGTEFYLYNGPIGGQGSSRRNPVLNNYRQASYGMSRTANRWKHRTTVQCTLVFIKTISVRIGCRTLRRRAPSDGHPLRSRSAPPPQLATEGTEARPYHRNTRRITVVRTHSDGHPLSRGPTNRTGQAGRHNHHKNMVPTFADWYMPFTGIGLTGKGCAGAGPTGRPNSGLRRSWGWRDAR